MQTLNPALLLSVNFVLNTLGPDNCLVLFNGDNTSGYVRIRGVMDIRISNHEGRKNPKTMNYDYNLYKMSKRKLVHAAISKLCYKVEMKLLNTNEID